MDWMIFWTAVEAIATCILLAGIGIAIWQIIVTRKNTKKQLEATRKSTNAQLAVQLFEKLRSNEILETAREIIYKNDRETIKGFLDDDERKEDMERIGRVLDWLDMLGVLVREDIVDKELAVMVYAGNMTIRCWYQLAPYIRELQDYNNRHSRGNYAENYEALAHQCLDIFDGVHMRCFLKGVDGDLVKLIQELPKDQCPRSLEEIDEDRRKRNKSELETNSPGEV